jgi:hypothetical protein
MKQVSRIATLTIFALSATAAFAQAAATPAPTPAAPRQVGSIAGRTDWPKAKSEDVQSPEAIVAAVYSVISGGKGQSRDWDRMRSLFVPDARLIPAITGKDGHNDVLMLSVAGYIERSGTRLTNDGFFERSIHNEMEQFGNIVQVWSTYESRHNLEDEKPFARGINSFQLLKDGDRYWVVNIFWDSESPTKPIPAKYLP